jgi:LuxR family transcriptional regulator, maltose regulon positive regulatory protein
LKAAGLSTPTRSALLATRLRAPAPQAVVRRARLLSGLDATLERRLTLVSAPAGFGKTTLVADWAAGLSKRGEAAPALAWLSLDEGDSDVSVFLAYVIAALQAIDARIGRGLDEALRAAAPDTGSVLTALLNDVLAALEGPPQRHAVLVLDDYHLTDSPQVDQALAVILDNLPSGLHLVVVSRIDPALPLARLRARGQMSEIRERDLRFTTAEASAFLAERMGLPVEATEAATLCARTEGWAAGLQLAALALQAADGDTARFIQAFSGTHRYILDYLNDEVFEHQPAEVQRFLLQASILSRLNSSLCDAVRGASGSQQMLEQLDQKSLFITALDPQRNWYRFHQLFGDLLRLRLEQTSPESVPELQARAGAWFADYAASTQDEEAIGLAVQHTLASGDFGRAAGVLARFADALWEHGRHEALRRWLGELPEATLARRPRLAVFGAWLDFVRGRYAQAEAGLAQAERAIQGQSGAVAEEVRGRIAATRAFIATFRADAADTIAWAEQALSLLPDERSTWHSSAAIALGDAHSMLGQTQAASEPYRQGLRASQAAGNRYLSLNAAYKLAANLRQRGLLPQAHQLCGQSIAAAGQAGLAQTAMAGCLYALRGDILCEWNQLPEASELTRRGLQAAAGAHHLGFAGWAHLYRARCLLAARDLPAVEETLSGLENLAQTAPLPGWIESPFAALRGLLALAQGNTQAALAWSLERGLSAEAAIEPMREFEFLVLARMLALRGQLPAAEDVLRRVLETAEAGGRVSLSLPTLVLQALVHTAQRQPAPAREALGRALALGEPGGFTRVFIDGGPLLVPLLKAASQSGEQAAYAQRLLAAISAQAPPAEPPGPPGALTEREHEVLRLVAAGLKNQEIADRLYISLNTVLYHTRNIYGKLQVTHRTQAVQRARELGLV